MFKTGDLNPHFFDWPSLTLYINALAYIPYYLGGKMMGVFHSPADIPGPIILAMGVGQVPMSTTFLLGRILTATFGSAAVALVFLSGRQLTKKTTVGLLAALMMAISPTSVANSRFITPDTFLVFFVLLSFWGSVGIFQQGETRHYIVAGIASGLAASSKYNGALIVLSVVLGHFLRCGLRGFKERRLYLTLALSAAAFFVTTPFALLDHQKFLANLQVVARHYATGHAGMEGNTLNWHLAYLWRVEGPVALLAVLEVLRGIYARSKQTVLLSAFPLVYFSFISSFVVRNDRTLLPLTPFLFVLASSLLVNLFRQTNTRCRTPDWYTANGFEYLIFGQGMFGRFYREPDRYSNEVSQYEDLFRAFDMVRTFTDGGYEVRIYHVTER